VAVFQITDGEKLGRADHARLRAIAIARIGSRLIGVRRKVGSTRARADARHAAKRWQEIPQHPIAPRLSPTKKVPTTSFLSLRYPRLVKPNGLFMKARALDDETSFHFSNMQ
jgi:hypothetical protein